MRKIYRYENLKFEADQGEEIKFEIKFISNGNQSHTIVNIPGENDPEIENEGKCNLGTVEQLKSFKTIVASDVANPIPQCTDIVIEYYLNDQLIVKHSNPKTETDRPFILLILEFSNHE